MTDQISKAAESSASGAAREAIKSMENQGMFAERGLSYYQLLESARSIIQQAINAETERLTKEIETLKVERLLLAKLADDEPQFFNPLLAIEVKNLRYRVLAEQESTDG